MGASAFHLANHANHGEHLHLGGLLKHDGWKIRIGRMQLQVPLKQLQHFAGRLISVPHGNDQVAPLGRNRPVNHQDVSIADACATHRPAIGPAQEGGRGIARQQSMQVDRIVHEVIGRRRETEPGTCRSQRHELSGAVDHGGPNGRGQRVWRGEGLHGRTLGGGVSHGSRRDEF